MIHTIHPDTGLGRVRFHVQNYIPIHTNTLITYRYIPIHTNTYRYTDTYKFKWIHTDTDQRTN